MNTADLFKTPAPYHERSYTPTQKLCISGLVMACYIVIMYFTQSFAFMTYQVRIATGLYALAWIHPFLAIPLSLANCLSNMLMGGLGLADVLGGVCVGLVTTGVIVLIRHLRLPVILCGAAIVLCISLVCSLWLAPLLGVSYGFMVLSLAVGELIPGIFGVILIEVLKNRL